MYHKAKTIQMEKIMKPRIFVSSTFYDLKILREEIHNFIKQYGFEPIECETGDIGYVPWQSLDKSCYEAMADCDMAILIVGGRYGSPKTGEKPSDFEEYISVTREEFRTAVKNGIPIYVFVDSKVHTEYELYKTNIDNQKILEGFKFKATQNINIFRFISEIYGIPTMAVTPFGKTQEIRDYLQGQWADLFKKYLGVLREEQRIASLEETVSNMRSLIDKMDVMLEGIGKKVLGSEDPDNYTEILESQGVINFARETSRAFSFKGIETISQSKREDMLLRFLELLEGSVKDGIWNKDENKEELSPRKIHDYFRDRGIPELDNINLKYGTYIKENFSLLKSDKIRERIVMKMCSDENFRYLLTIRDH